MPSSMIWWNQGMEKGQGNIKYHSHQGIILKLTNCLHHKGHLKTLYLYSFDLLQSVVACLVLLRINDQIWRVGLNFNWKGIYSLSPSEMKGNINNCTLMDKYKLTNPFHTKKCKNQILFFQCLLWKHACMWWRGLSQLNPCNSLHVWV